MKRKIVVFGVALFVVAAGCAQGEQGGTQDDGPQTRTVQVDGSPDGFEAFALAYFPNEVTVRPGDTVRFTQHFTGEPHSVTMGTIVDELIPQALEAMQSGDEPPEALMQDLDRRLPSMLPEGPGDANQIAVNPCYVASGDVPEDATKPCPDQEQPAFTGQHAYYSSGFLPEGEDFDVELSEDVAAGTYTYYCNLHGPEMSGTIEVVEAGTEIPDEDAVEQAREEQLAEAFTPLEAAYEEAESGQTPFGNLAGYGSEEAESTGIIEFLPDTIEAEAGEKVTWTIFGPHSITFNPPRDAVYALVERDGTWHLSEEATAPAGGPGQPQPEGDLGDEERPVDPPEGPPQPTEVDAGSWDGEDFRSSGLFFSFPPELFSYSLTFTEPGSYQYLCTVHPKMTGVVEVS